MKLVKSLLVIGMIVGLVSGCQNYQASSSYVNAVKLVEISIKHPPEVVTSQVIQIKEVVLFDFDSDKLDTEAMEIVTGVAELMKKYPDTEINLAGHTDKYGSDDYNNGLSLRRANAVQKALVDLGVDEDRIVSAQGLGKQELLENIMSNRENRRVIILSVE